MENKPPPELFEPTIGSTQIGQESDAPTVAPLPEKIDPSIAPEIKPVVSLKSLLPESGIEKDFGPTTPQKLMASLIAIWLLVTSFGLAAVIGTNFLRDAGITFGKRNFSSTLTAQETRADLIELNTSTLDIFLTTSEQRRQESLEQYDRLATKTTDLLVSAANDDKSDLVVIEKLIEAFQKYLRLSEAAKIYHHLHSNEAPQALLIATQYLRSEILPLSDKLLATRQDRIEQAFNDCVNRESLLFSIAIVSGAVLILALICLQIYLKHKVRRLLNFWLVMATVFASATLGVFYLECHKCLDALISAKDEAYSEMNTLWQMRSAANEANGLESMYLLNEDHQTEYQNNFTDKSKFVSDCLHALARSPLTSGGGDLSTTQSEQRRSGTVKAQINAWNEYMSIDQSIRRLEYTGNHDAAVQLCLGTSQNQSEYAFANLSAAVSDNLECDQKLLDYATGLGVKTLRLLGATCAGISLAIAVLAWLGVRARTREYR